MVRAERGVEEKRRNEMEEEEGLGWGMGREREKTIRMEKKKKKKQLLCHFLENKYQLVEPSNKDRSIGPIEGYHNKKMKKKREKN